MDAMKLTSRDHKLLQYLRGNSRASLTQISRATQIPISTLYDRIKAQQGHIIRKHTTLINFEALGFHSRAQLLFKVHPQQKEEMQRHLTLHEQVNSVYRVASEYDFCIEGVFRHIKEVQEFIDTVQQRFEILDYKTYYFVEDLKREGFFSM